MARWCPRPGGRGGAVPHPVSRRGSAGRRPCLEQSATAPDCSRGWGDHRRPTDLLQAVPADEASPETSAGARALASSLRHSSGGRDRGGSEAHHRRRPAAGRDSGRAPRWTTAPLTRRARHLAAQALPDRGTGSPRHRRHSTWRRLAEPDRGHRPADHDCAVAVTHAVVPCRQRVARSRPCTTPDRSHQRSDAGCRRVWAHRADRTGLMASAPSAAKSAATMNNAT